MNLLSRRLTSFSEWATKHVELLGHLEIRTLRDLLFHFPSRYIDKTRVTMVSGLRDGIPALMELYVTSVNVGPRQAVVQAQDLSGKITLRFFHLHRWPKEQWQPGRRVQCFGEPKWQQQGWIVTHPEYHWLDRAGPVPVEEHLTPIYPTKSYISQRFLRMMVHKGLKILRTDKLYELPAAWRTAQGWPSFMESLQFIHCPSPDVSPADLEHRTHPAQQHLIAEELLAYRLRMSASGRSEHQDGAFELAIAPEIEKRFLNMLPFELTPSQKRILEETRQDLSAQRAAWRLIQGDVGSGKTVIAAWILLHCAINHTQGALMVPTELLAQQHYQTLKQWFEPFQIEVLLLTGKRSAAEKRKMQAELSQNKPIIAIGTQALIQNSVEFSCLSAIVIDEQHRFGVSQRLALPKKSQSKPPHQFLLTATPIPRTLSMVLHSQMSHSSLDELPTGRLPVQTTIMSNAKKNLVIERLKEKCSLGEQAYWICVAIDSAQDESISLALDAYELLSQELLPLKVGLLHGRLKKQTKEEVMQAFKDRSIQVLVATTVVEVGVDVPNATVMVIENAERLGLAQLHQLRGRVGRGKMQSFCVLLYSQQTSPKTKQRLEALRQYHNGQVLAELDLKWRGAGDFMGTQQSGIIPLQMADWSTDQEWFQWAYTKSKQLEAEYPELIPHLIEHWTNSTEEYHKA